MEKQISASGTAVLAVSFGTGYRQEVERVIGAIEKAIAHAFPDYTVYRAFTSEQIRKRLRESGEPETDYVRKALDRIRMDGMKKLIVQPTFLLYGQEYRKLAAELQNAGKQSETAGMRIYLGKPLLAKKADVDAVLSAVTKRLAVYDDGKTALCLMGHGTQTGGKAVYARMQEQLAQAGCENYYIGTMQANPGPEDVMAALKAHGSYQRVVLYPLMLTAGMHAHREMAGSGEGTWKTEMERAGYETICLLEGIGQIAAIRDIYVKHVQDACPVSDEAGEVFGKSLCSWV